MTHEHEFNGRGRFDSNGKITVVFDDDGWIERIYYWADELMHSFDATDVVAKDSRLWIAIQEQIDEFLEERATSYFWES